MTTPQTDAAAAAPASRPSPSAAPGPSAVATRPESARPVSPSSAPIPARPSQKRSGYLEAALADYRRELLPNGALLAIKRQAGRTRAGARLVLARSGAPGQDRLEDLLLRAELAGALAGAGADIRLSTEDDTALEIDCARENLEAVLTLVARELSSPSFSQAELDRAVREARVELRREAGKPLQRAKAGLREGCLQGLVAESSPSREELLRHWSSRFGAERLSLILLCDGDPRALAESLAATFGGLPRKGERPVPASPLPMPSRFTTLPLSATPGAALLRGEYEAPGPGSADSAALTLAFAMLADLLDLRLGRAEPGPGEGGFRLNPGYPTASATFFRTSDPAAAKACFDAALSDLAGGRCLDPAKGDGELGEIALGLEAYKARAITSWYSEAASSFGLASLMARDLAAGGDGSAPFRMASRINEVSPGDLSRVARQRLLEAPSSWIALGDPELLARIDAAAFLNRPLQAR